ncbi:IS4 family transposase [Verrucomicrobiota bacterium]
MSSVATRSLFSQILSIISRHEFARHVRELKGEKGAKGFTCWQQFVSMLFCQLAQAKSLREICDGLKCCLGKLNHLGIEEAPKKSTLSYANRNRPWESFQKTFYDVLSTCRAVAPGKPFRFKNPLYSLDMTVIELCAQVFDWARYMRTKGAIKLHLLLDHDGYLPTFAHITEGKTHEVRVARTLELPAGSIVAMDKAYHDFALYRKWTKAGIWFVTKLKSNADFRVVKRLKVPKHPDVWADELIEFGGAAAKRQGISGMRFRRIVVWDPDNLATVVLLSNHLQFGATTITRIYKARWKIEEFFRALKQNLKVKTFVGVNANAVRIQIWTALIAMLLLKYLAFVVR